MPVNSGIVPLWRLLGERHLPYTQTHLYYLSGKWDLSLNLAKLSIPQSEIFLSQAKCVTHIKVHFTPSHEILPHIHAANVPDGNTIRALCYKRLKVGYK